VGSIHQYKLPVEVVAATIPRRRRESRTDDPPRNSNKVFRTWLDCCYVFNVICGESPRQKVLQVSLFQSGENLLAQRRNRRISTHHTSLQCQSHDDKSMRCQQLRICHDCRSLLTLETPRVEALCAVPIRLPRCLASTLSIASAGMIVDRGDCRKVFELTCLKVRTRSLVMSATPDARWI